MSINWERQWVICLWDIYIPQPGQHAQMKSIFFMVAFTIVFVYMRLKEMTELFVCMTHVHILRRYLQKSKARGHFSNLDY